MKAPRPKEEAFRKKGPSFAPPSEIKDLGAYLKPTRGPVLEVLVAWKERIIACYHFPQGKKVVLGPREKDDIQLPSKFVSGSAPLFESSPTAGTRVYLKPQMTPEIRQEGKVYDLSLLNSQGRISHGRHASALFLEQGELLSLQLGEGTVQIFIRHVPITLTPPAKGFALTGGEITGVVLSCVLVVLFAFYLSIDKATREAQGRSRQPKLANFIYEKVPSAAVAEADGPTKPVKLKKVALSSVKTTDKAAANGSIKKDINRVGLLNAFGGKGNRKNLDKVSSGIGELLGEASTSTGFSGQNTNRSGDDLGGKFKDVGTERTATQGIAGVSTQGRSAGQINYGRVGAGRKGAIALELVDRGVEFVGTVDREQVRRVVRSILSQIKGCFDRALVMNSGLEGKIVILWEVGEQGRVRAAKVKEAAEEMRGVALCAMGKIRAQKFPDPPAGSYYEVSYPFLMSKLD